MFDEEKCFDKEKEEVKGIFEDNGTLLDTPIDESVFSSKLYKSLEAEKQVDDLKKPDNYDVPTVRVDYYQALTGGDACSEALASDDDHYEALTDEDSYSEALVGEDDHSEALTFKDGQQFVTTERVEEDNLVSKVQ